MPTLGVIVAAYLLGSVSFAVVVSKIFGLPDPHSYGSGNPVRPTYCAPATRRRRC
jgi:glycerol-3-phosphate acyltransferase PlsY